MTTASGSQTPNPSQHRPFLRPSWPKLALALLIGAGLGYAPSLGQTESHGTAQALSNPREIPKLPPQAKQLLKRPNDPQGNKIALVRVIDEDVDPADSNKPVRTFANADPKDTWRDEEADQKGVVIEFEGHDDNAASAIRVDASLPKSYLRQFETDPNAPLEVISVSIVVKAGTNTCVWDCYWSNGKKICECVNI